MKDQELRDIFHAYRPEIADDDAFMDKLRAQMDAIDHSPLNIDHSSDAQLMVNRQSSIVNGQSIIQLYRRILPWAAGIAAAIIAAVFVMKEPVSSPVTSSYESRLAEYYHTHSDFASYEEIVDEIERSGRQLENAIAQL